MTTIGLKLRNRTIDRTPASTANAEPEEPVVASPNGGEKQFTFSEELFDKYNFGNCLPKWHRLFSVEFVFAFILSIILGHETEKALCYHLPLLASKIASSTLLEFFIFSVLGYAWIHYILFTIVLVQHRSDSEKHNYGAVIAIHILWFLIGGLLVQGRGPLSLFLRSNVRQLCTSQLGDIDWSQICRPLFPCLYK